MIILPVRSMLYPNEQLPAYSPRYDPETSSVLSSAPSYTSAAPSYHSAVPPTHTGDGYFYQEGYQQDTPPWATSNANGSTAQQASHGGASVWNNDSPTPPDTTGAVTGSAQQPSTPSGSTTSRATAATAAARTPSQTYAPGFENRALSHGHPSDSQLRMMYNTSSWVSMSNGLQSRTYENVARRRAQQAKAEAMLLRSRGLHAGYQSMTDISARRDSLAGRRGSLSNLTAAAAAAATASAATPPPSGSTDAAVTAAATRSPVGSALYGLVNASAVTVTAASAASVSRASDDPITRVATPAHRDCALDPPTEMPEEVEEEGDGSPLLPHEDPFLVGEEAARRARNRRLYITSQTQENQLHGILSATRSRTPDPALSPAFSLGAASRPTTPGVVHEARPRRQTDAGITTATTPAQNPAMPQYTSLVEQGLQARAQRSRSASVSNAVTTTAVRSSAAVKPRSGSVSAPAQPSTTPTRRPPMRSALPFRTRSSTALPTAVQSPLTEERAATAPKTGEAATQITTSSTTQTSTAATLSPALPSARLASASCTNLLPPTLEADEEQQQQQQPQRHRVQIAPTRPPARPSTARPRTASTRDEQPIPLSSFIPLSPPPSAHASRRRSPSPGFLSSGNDSPYSSTSQFPRLTPSITAPQLRSRRGDSMDGSASSESEDDDDFADANDDSRPVVRISPTQEALMIAQESKQWDFMMSQMADWEERQRTWKKFRDDMERKFCSGRRLGLGFSGLVGWSPFQHAPRSKSYGWHATVKKGEKRGRGRKRAISSGAQTSGSWRRRVVGLSP
ncbi:hypothetical protein KEM52_005977 [Ascosphaera acerosa]|nr:hypothetical protein KEM52_005977 [Ascosphaera acerosa]